MPTYRCDYTVKGDLVLPNGAGELALHGSQGSKITLRNGDTDEEGHTANLLAIVVGSAPTLGKAQKTLRGFLIERLDLLSFVTRCRFEVLTARRVFEWEPHQKESNRPVKAAG
jgi:hypothetical protein